MSRTGDALRAAGLNVFDDRPVRGRPYSFGPILGFMDHHTVSSASDASQVAMLKRGRSDLPGPLCQIYVAHSIPWGVAVISEGRANHAGRGSMSWVPGTDGNRYFRGAEVGHLGNAPITGHQYQILLRANAAILKMDGLPYYRVIGHKEWTSRKIDIRNNMNTVRADTRTVMGAPPPKPKPPPPPPPPPPPKPPEDEVTPEDIAKIIAGVTAALKPHIDAANAPYAALSASVATGVGLNAHRQTVEPLLPVIDRNAALAYAALVTDYERWDSGDTYGTVAEPDYLTIATTLDPALTAGGDGGTTHHHNVTVNTTTGGPIQ